MFICYSGYSVSNISSTDIECIDFIMLKNSPTYTCSIFNFCIIELDDIWTIYTFAQVTVISLYCIFPMHVYPRQKLWDHAHILENISGIFHSMFCKRQIILREVLVQISYFNRKMNKSLFSCLFDMLFFQFRKSFKKYVKVTILSLAIT